MADSSFRGRFLWHELLTSDMASAAKFFGKIVGWKTEAWTQSPHPYTLLKMDRPMAGLMALKDAQMEGAPPFWMSYIGTPDVDDAARQAVSLGAKIEKAAADIPTIGRFAVMSDPQGAGFILFTPLPPQGGAPAPDFNARPGLGDFSWHELATTDWKAALTFYKKMFGWEETSAMDMGPGMGTYQMFGIGGVPMGGIFNKPAQMPGPPNWLPYIRIKDAKAVAAAVPGAGGKVVNGPMEVPGGDWIAQALDPQGGMFAVHSLNPAPAAAAAPPRPGAARKAAAKKAAPAKAKKQAAAAKKAAPREAAKVTKKAAKKAVPKRKAASKRKAAGRKKAGKKR